MRRRPTFPKPDPRLTPTALLRYFKIGSRRLIIAEHDSSLWVTDSYMLARLNEKSTTALGDFLRRFNLDVEPMRCDVNQTVVRISGPDEKQIDIGKVLRKNPGLPVIRHQINGMDLLVAVSSKDTAEVWKIDSGPLLTVNPTVVSMVTALVPEGDWRGVDAISALMRVNGKRVDAAAMPVRSLLTGFTESDVAA